MTNAALVFTLCILSILGGVIICGVCIAVREIKKYREHATVQTGNLILALATSSAQSAPQSEGGAGQTANNNNNRQGGKSVLMDEDEFFSENSEDWKDDDTQAAVV
ncbi:Hypothetical protein FKW44_003617 [Caligus rogercresseyi]|uniref:Uncharacterized protein n=1 Tax=Caligus rogercresseyi TaxID=217165 RepID=A0A7T8QX52_CALRO|nr:Hypothetical protein FKW44_003617 [Caligus rogercresseyi]